MLSSAMSGVSTAMPYVGAAMLADQFLLDGAISDTIGKVIGGIGDAIGFGSSRKYKAGFTQTSATPTGPVDERYYDSGNTEGLMGGRQTAFGSYGFTFKEKVEPDDMVALLDTMEQFDNALASVMNTDQVEGVRAALDGFETKIKNDPLGDIFADRLQVILDTVDTSFDDLLVGVDPTTQAQRLVASLQIDTLTADLGDAVVDDINTAFREAVASGADLSGTVQSITASVQSLDLMRVAVEKLNLQFDATADGALDAASNIASLAGGVDQLAAIQQNYYQAVFSDNERLSDSYQSLGEQFDALGVEMPNNVDALRDLVESQALNTDESRKLQLQLMQLAPAFAETTSSIRDALTQQYQDVLDRAPDAEGLNYWIDEIQSGSVSLEHALASIANSAEATTAELKEIMQSASDDYESAMSQARDYLAGITNSLSEYLDQLHSTDAGLASPGDQLAAAAGAFSEQYQLALSGDRDALGSITQYASRLIDAQTQWSGSGTQTQDVIADITSKLEQLPERLSPEQFLADEIRDAITDGISDLTDGIATTIAGSFEAIDFNQDDVIDWSEFRRQFEGLVDNDTLRDIFGALDNNGNGVIDQLESDARAIEAWSSQQPESAQGAIQQMLDMYEEILGRQADLPGIDYYLDQYFDGMSLEEIRARLEDSPEAGGGSSSGGGSGSTGGSYKPGGSDAEGDPLLSDATGDLADAFRDVLGRDPDDSGYAYYQDQLNSGNMTLDEIRDRLADSPEAGSGGSSSGGSSGSSGSSGGGYTSGGSDAEGDPLLSDATGDLADAFRDTLGRDPDDSGYAYYQDQLNSGNMTLDEIRDRLADSPEAHGSHATGLNYVPFDGYRAELHKGEFVATAAQAPAVRAFLDGSLPPVVIPPPAMGGMGDRQIEALLRDNNRLMQQNVELMQRLEQHGAAGVRVAQTGHTRQIDETRKGNKLLSRMASDSRLEAAKA